MQLYRCGTYLLSVMCRRDEGHEGDAEGREGRPRGAPGQHGPRADGALQHHRVDKLQGPDRKLLLSCHNQLLPACLPARSPWPKASTTTHTLTHNAMCVCFPQAKMLPPHMLQQVHAYFHALALHKSRPLQASAQYKLRVTSLLNVLPACVTDGRSAGDPADDEADGGHQVTLGLTGIDYLPEVRV